MLDDLASFQRVLFTNARVRELSDAIRSGVTPLPDPDPPLNAFEQQGKAVFVRACAHCHGGPGQSSTEPPVVRFHDISTQCPRPIDTRPADVVTPERFAFAPCPPRLARNARTYATTVGTTTVQRPGLRGISKTAPYFHNNSAATLEEVVDHYIEFFKRVRVIAGSGPAPPVASTDGVHFDRRPTVEERAALLAYLRKL